MIIYSGNKTDFIAREPELPKYLRKTIMERLGEETSDNEFLSWKNSLSFMRTLMDTPTIPDDAGVALEYNIPVTNNRIDFIVTGLSSDAKSQVIIIELKQWSSVQKTDMDGIVITRYEEGLKETTHPSYQAACYASLLYDYKEAVQKREVTLHPCAYLHNCVDDSVVKDAFYAPYTIKAPVFCKSDQEKLREFICTYIRKGDRQKGLFVIEDSQIRPSQNLADSITKMMNHQRVFNMVDTQKVAYQRILKAFDKYKNTGKKQVVIIEGGPGTGKSVIAVNLLQRVIREGRMAAYVTKNAAPRNVFYRKLVDGGMGAKNVNALFKSSIVFYGLPSGQFDMLIVDEAHRLNEKSGRYSRGENQVKEIINCSKVAVFFIDEAQRVDIKDIGSKAEVRKWAKFYGCEIDDSITLTAQFRCGGSDEYLQWVDQLLEIRQTGQVYLSKESYDLKICETPKELLKEIRKKNQKNNKSRCVAGYCWEWKSRTDPSKMDIVFPEYNFSAQWNLSNDDTWSISEGSVSQIGCIHTCQGLEFDYVGVIIGPDIIYRDGHILVDPSKRSPDDYTIRGYKTMMKSDPEGTKNLIRQIIKNTYRTLMTRGMKGCYLYVMDDELREYIKSRITK